MKYAPIFGLIILLIAMLSCRSSSSKRVRHSDPFYNDTGEGRFLVVPLIKPYRVVTDEGSSVGWSIKLDKTRLIDDNLYLSLRDIEQIAVDKGIIMVFAPNDPWHWAVIIPEQEIEEGFDNEEGFLNYIREFGIENPNWIEPMAAFQQFEKTGCLDWIPDCE